MSGDSNVVEARDVLPYAMEKLGSSQIQTSKSYTEFNILHQLDFLSSLNADALGLKGVSSLSLHVTLPSDSYYGGPYQPGIGIKVVTHGRCQSDSPYATILNQISKICQIFFEDRWPYKTQLDTLEFLPRLYLHIQARLPLLGSFCIVCGCQQEHIGLKPQPCNAKGCNLAFSEDGTGADLRLIYNQPIIADLLITMASAACQCVGRRDSLFGTVPDILQLTSQENSNNASTGQQVEWQCMQAAFQSLAPVKEMAQEPNLRAFFKTDLQAGMMKFRLLRWVLNSCQGHLVQLEGADRFPMMQTEYQFRLWADRSDKEHSFARLKQKYGSRFLFHGSPFYNWHCILREGLKNMSGTSMMSNGHSLGSGIYLAENSKESAQHCSYRDACAIPAYPNSIFGREPLCLALCEVIDHPSHARRENWAYASGLRVVPDADNVIMRYLLVYNSDEYSVNSFPYSFFSAAVPSVPSVRASTLRNRCNQHAEAQAAVLDTLRQAAQHL